MSRIMNQSNDSNQNSTEKKEQPRPPLEITPPPTAHDTVNNTPSLTNSLLESHNHLNRNQNQYQHHYAMILLTTALYQRNQPYCRIYYIE